MALFVAEGSRLVLDLLRSAPEKLNILCCTKEWFDVHPELEILDSSRMRILEEHQLQSISSLKSTEEVLAVFGFPEFGEFRINASELVIYLDRIRDPGNLGTIIRSADWFGLRQVYCTPDSVDVFNNKCVQASMASVMRVQVCYESWETMKSKFSGIPRHAAIMEGTPYYQLNPDDVQFICFGNEALGLSKELISDCPATISIPAENGSRAESLNLSIACSVLMAWKTKPR
ncbi:MAG TPA: TrmH family RNA methyltransferase [Saprospiraceae bacterium]|nr:TrmH family RNA methyltransferase [Saprospiraceae bacterium]